MAGSAASGNPDYIVRRVYNPQSSSQPPVNYGYGLIYNTQGTLWFITQVQWTGATCPQEEHEVISRHEFRSVGRAMRLTREWDLDYFNLPKSGTNVWHDYDGDEIYADTLIDHEPEYTVTPLAAHEPGIGSYHYASNAASYRHGDQIGSTRAITGPGSAGVPPASIQGRIVYTAFGERVWSDGTIGTRYQYAGAWGYQSDLYEDAGANALPSSLFPAPFIHVGHRWYDPSTGRFLQRDPIGIAKDVNVYSYARHNPVLQIDPTGLGTIWPPGWEPKSPPLSQPVPLPPPSIPVRQPWTPYDELKWHHESWRQCKLVLHGVAATLAGLCGPLGGAYGAGIEAAVWTQEVREAFGYPTDLPPVDPYARPGVVRTPGGGIVILP